MTNPFSVGKERYQKLRQQMERLGIQEGELLERFVRSGGPGGQNVNKVATCVWLRHIPTGLEVKVQRERSQAMNRFLARRLLVEKLEAREWALRMAKQSRAARIRRQKRSRSPVAKEKILAFKKRHSLKKRLRKAAQEDD